MKITTHKLKKRRVTKSYEPSVWYILAKYYKKLKWECLGVMRWETYAHMTPDLDKLANVNF